MSYPGVGVNILLLDQVDDELCQAERKHGPIHSLHEGLAVIDEELHEFRMEVYKDQPNYEHARRELIQVAAMALRTIKDCCL